MGNHLEIGQIIHETVGSQTIRPKVDRESPTTQEVDSEHQTTTLEEGGATLDPTVPTHRAQTVHEGKATVAIKAQGVQETAE